MNFYKRNLPHWQPPEAEYFTTFRLDGSIPKKAVKRIKQLRKQLLKRGDENSDQLDEIADKINRRIFQKYEDLLENNDYGPLWLEQPEVARMVCNAMEYRDDQQYDLYAYCVMPNHVHLIFKLLPMEEKLERPVTKILQSLKRYTAGEANKILDREGQFWQHESFDRVVRDNEELESTVKYVLNNPVKAGLIENWQDWPYSYYKTEFESSLV